jgi:hypothetical protein
MTEQGPEERGRRPWLIWGAAIVLVLLLALAAHFAHAEERAPTVAVIASVCLDQHCRDIVVTTSEQDPRVSVMSCQFIGPQALADWMTQNWPGYRLAGWKCVFGRKGQSA